MPKSYSKHGGINIVLLIKRDCKKKVLSKERKSTYYSVCLHPHGWWTQSVQLLRWPPSWYTGC